MNSSVDLFKLCKLPDLKELEKKGQVTITHEKTLGRKVLAIQGNVSTANYIKLCLSKSRMPLNHRYLYLQCIGEAGHTFSFQLTVHSNGKAYKLNFSSLHKTVKQLNNQTVNYPIAEFPHSRWTILVVDLHQFAQEVISLNEIKLNFGLAEVELRATMRIKGAYLGHQLWSAEELPKDLALPLHGNQLFFDKYAYSILGGCQNENIDASNEKAKGREKRNEDPELEKSEQRHQRASTHSRHRSNTKEGSAKKPDSHSLGQEQLKKSKSNDKHVTFSDRVGADEQPKPEKEVPKPNKAIGRPPKQQTKNSRASPVTSSTQRPAIDNDQGMVQMIMTQPRPSPTLEASLLFHQGAKVAIGSYYTLGRYLFTPEPIETHKNISFFKRISANLTIVAYEDGTVAYFDTMMKQPLKYFQTGLETVSGLYPDQSGALVLTGQDYMRRHVLMVVADDSILYKQISNYDIRGLLLVNEQSYSSGMVTFGLENVRIWRVKKELITGSCVYLGEAVRKVSFNSGFMSTPERAYIVSSNGNLNIINVAKCTLEEAVKLDQNSVELDHCKRLDERSFVTASSYGTVRVHSLSDLGLLLQIPLQHRIKYLQLSSPDELLLTHFNGTVGKLLIGEAKYQFLMRSHSDSVLSLHYQQMYKRLVTTSRDGSIRVWRIFGDSLSQQYQFQINDDQLTSLVVLQSAMTFVAGFESGLLRMFDMSEFKLTQQREYHGVDVVALDVSRDDKLILSGDRDGSVRLLDGQLEVLCEYEATPQDNLKVGFNKRGDTFFITTTPLEITIFSTRSFKAVQTIYIDSVGLQNIIFCGELLHVVTASSHTIYRNLKFERLYKLEAHSALALNYPLVVSCHTDSTLTMKIAGSQVQQEVRVPERIGGVVLPDNDDQGLMFAWGQASRAIYCWRVKARNLPKIEEMPVPLPDPEQLRQVDHSYTVHQESQLDVTFMGDSVRTVQQPTSLVASSANQQTFLNRPESSKFVAGLGTTNKLRAQEDQNEFLEMPAPKSGPQVPKQEAPVGSGQPTPIFMYGFPQSSPALTEFIWNSQQRYLVVPSHEYLVVHFFTRPFRQKLVRLPYRPNHLKATQRFLSFSNRNCISLYDCQTFAHFKSTLLEGDDIISYCFSSCSNYLITASSHSSRRILIGVTEVATGKLITQSYLATDQRPTIMANPYSQRIEFVLYTAGSLHYYRVTSIQTLQYQELGIAEVVSKTNGLSTAQFALIDSTELLLIGTIDGSLLVVDSRSATLLVLCKSVIKSPVLQIRLADGLLALITNTINIYVWKEVNSLNELLESVAEKEPSVLPLDSPLTMVSQQNTDSKLMGCSRLGVLWLIDLTQCMTIKVMCSHTKPLNCVDPIDSDKLVTGSDDCAIGITCLSTLEQISSFYKPKKPVQCLKWIAELGMLMAGQGNLLCFYTPKDVLGSCTMQGQLCSIEHIPNTRNMLVGTRTEVLMIHLQCQSPLKIQVKKLADIKDQLVRLQMNPSDIYDTWLGGCRNGKINVWSRKCLKRLYDPVEELEKVQELEYYLIDNYQPTAKSNQEVTAHFMSAVSYLCLNHETGKLQERNFKEHIILREIQLFAASCFEIYDDRLLLGTTAGELAIIDQNGLTLSKQRLLEEGIRGMVIRNNKAYLYGDRVMCCYLG